MLDNLTARLTKIVKQIRGEARLTESNIQEALREVRVALLEADAALPVVKHFIDAVRAKALGAEVVGSLTPGQALVGVVHRELTALMERVKHWTGQGAQLSPTAKRLVKQFAKKAA